ncbi:TIGR02281 family clan AA aspartic protease [Roseiarcaceae bacterium H3SJ34-1]|uniref:retropepsin-like aspartic protease family protein n=1 Tax=Terripilifer ovatus TaxID=3032367 RepID=UPI003AB9952F|nr:TIGR02281 family clan AA aspartic protease [Roseiarcaceae bacterium H3SJ34-1]
MLNKPVKLAAIAGLVALGAAMLLSKSGGQLAGASATGPLQPSLSGLSDFIDRFRVQTSVAIPGTGKDVTRAPTQPASGFGPVRLSADETGHYFSNVEIDGRRIRMLVDTGATLVILTYEDAAALGINPAPSDYTAKVLTANGDLMTAKTQLREIRVGNILVRDVAALVVPAGRLKQSLLGMSFLSKLKSFEVADRSLILTP